MRRLLPALLLAAAPAWAGDQLAPHPGPDFTRALLRESRELTHRGVVAETHVAGLYVYIRVDEEDGPLWLAAPKQDVPLGYELRWGDGVEMRDFTSIKLDRFFHRIVFVDRIETFPRTK